MTAIRDSLARYVAVRRALGASFYEPALALGHFVDLLEREGAEFITTDLALRWATTPYSSNVPPGAAPLPSQRIRQMDERH